MFNATQSSKHQDFNTKTEAKSVSDKTTNVQTSCFPHEQCAATMENS